MYEIRIPDELYREACEAASVHQVSIEQFVTEAVRFRLQSEPENLDDRFTPDVVAHLDRIAVDLDNAAKTYTPEEVRAHLQANRAAWLKSHPR